MAGRNLGDRLRPLRRLAGPIEAAEVRRFGRSGLSILFRTPVLVLETTGRRTGATRRTTLAYHHERDGSVLIVGGAGGQTRIPDWVANLRAHSHAVITLDRARRDVVATELTGAERAAVWDELRTSWRRIDKYERQAGRPVPVFRLR